MSDVSGSVVSFQGVHHAFAHNVAVENFDLEIGVGERVAILGRTGAGKSTVLNLLVGTLKPTSGRIRVAGKDPYSEHQALQSIIGMAFQSPRLLPWRTALDNVAVGQEVMRVPRKERLANAERWLGRMHLSEAAQKYPSQLSGGMRQRVSLARAFSIDPALVLLDESFSALDEVTARQLRAEFIELADEQGQAALIVTHNIEEAFTIAHRVIVLGVPARIVGEFVPAQEPAVGTPEFTALAADIRDRMR